nr:MAG TPA: hypothetical protein [Caudoviricetes sp.]
MNFSILTEKQLCDFITERLRPKIGKILGDIEYEY